MRDNARSIRDQLEMIARETREERRRSEADVTPEPTPVLDDAGAAPLTDPDDTKGG